MKIETIQNKTDLIDFSDSPVFKTASALEGTGCLGKLRSCTPHGMAENKNKKENNKNRKNKHSIDELGFNFS